MGVQAAWGARGAGGGAEGGGRGIGCTGGSTVVPTLALLYDIRRRGVGDDGISLVLFLVLSFALPFALSSAVSLVLFYFLGTGRRRAKGAWALPSRCFSGRIRFSVCCCGGGRKLPLMAWKPPQEYGKTLVDHEISLVYPARRPT